jgi:hypothetical protein
MRQSYSSFTSGVRSALAYHGGLFGGADAIERVNPSPSPMPRVYVRGIIRPWIVSRCHGTGLLHVDN